MFPTIDFSKVSFPNAIIIFPLFRFIKLLKSTDTDSITWLTNMILYYNIRIRIRIPFVELLTVQPSINIVSVTNLK